METDINKGPERVQSEKYNAAAPGIPKVELSENAAASNLVWGLDSSA